MTAAKKRRYWKYAELYAVIHQHENEAIPMKQIGASHGVDEKAAQAAYKLACRKLGTPYERQMWGTYGARIMLLTRSDE